MVVCVRAKRYQAIYFVMKIEANAPKNCEVRDA
jgi:hypothetical protein